MKRLHWEAGLFVAALTLGGAGALPALDQDLADTLFFAAWCAALLLMLALGLRIPLRLGGGVRGAAAGAGVVVVAMAIVLLANVALYRRDVHFDVTRTARNTAPDELRDVVAALTAKVTISYFRNAADPNAAAAVEALRVLARRQKLLHLRDIDLDAEPQAARAAGVRAYNTLLVESGGRRTLVENTVDLRQAAYAVLRVQMQRTPVVCFVGGHGEPPVPGDTGMAFTHVETLQGHEVPGAGDTVAGAGEGIDRLRIALDQFGFAVRPLLPATVAAVPEACSVVAAIGGRLPWTEAEIALLRAHFLQGGRVLLTLDPDGVPAPALRCLLAEVGVSPEDGTVVDPLNHQGTDATRIAVPYYPPHPVTDRLGMTIFAGARGFAVTKPPDGVSVTPLFASSKDSIRRPAEERPAAPAILGVALQGRWPGSEAGAAAMPFRLVLVGNSAFATNAQFSVVANGALALAMLRWLAGDIQTSGIRPAAYALPEIVLTRAQMQVVFLLVEVLLPLSVTLIGLLVWWRRR
jgi:hypothetical protein